MKIAYINYLSQCKINNMKKELITELFLQFEQACYDFKGIECWSARELQTILGYTEWRNFLKVVDKAKDACTNAGEDLKHHFVDVNKMIALAKTAQREIEDIALTRYACYLIAQNGDASKQAIATLDESFFRVRFDRLTPKEKRYLRAMAELGAGPHRSGDVAQTLSVEVSSLAPTRNSLMKKGMLYSPSHGDTAFTVPLFDEFMHRIMPSDDWRT